jgi:hypothetical protein
MNHQLVDTALFVIANLFNVLVTLIFLSRPFGLKRLEYLLGLINVTLALPAGIAAVLNALAGREWWSVLLPALLVVYLLVELLLDYLLELDFRHTNLLGPYLLLFYASQMGMIGYAFLVDETYGFVTLLTYFLCLAATAYSYRKVGHGSRGGE